MISVDEALARILKDLPLMPAEQVPVSAALGRVLAADAHARRTQPPKAVSAMDGYAVRAVDVATVPATLTRVGSSAAGRGFAGAVGPGQAVRIFTGAPVPDGADCIVIQEDVDAEAAQDGARITVREGVPTGRYVRPAGLDFKAGDLGAAAGRVLTVRDIGLLAAMDLPWLTVRRQPRVAVLATGDEIVRPGEPIGPDQIVSSNSFALGAFVQAAGGEPIDLGIAPDDREGLKTIAAGARGADMLVTTGGASVGEHDLVRDALGDIGLAVDFWTIAMRPGKPLIFGRIGAVPFLGLPGNPVSALVCATVFLGPAIARMLGIAATERPRRVARLGCDLPANDRRQDFLRATLSRGEDGGLVATPFAKQDSSMLSLLARADCLVVRAPEAPSAKTGETVEFLLLGAPLAGI